MTTETHTPENYWQLPYGVRILASDFSATWKFSTLNEAIAYLDQQYSCYAEVIKHKRHVSFSARRSMIILPNGVEVAAREFIGDDLCSY